MLIGVLDSAMGEVQELHDFLQSLQGRRLGSLAPLDMIMQAKTGAKVLLKQTVKQSKHWKSIEQKLRSSHVAVETMMPDVFAAQQALTDHTISWPTIVGKYSTWLDALPANNTAELERQVQMSLGEELAKREVPAALGELATTARQLAASMPQNMRTRAFFLEFADKAVAKRSEVEKAALQSEVRSTLLQFCKDRQGAVIGKWG